MSADSDAALERRSLRAEHAELYRVAVLEVRFQVQLNWDRTKHYLVFNAALIAAAASIARVAPSTYADAVALGLSVLAAINSWVGAYSTKVGHLYYRRARDKMNDIAGVLRYDEPVSRRSDVTVALGTTLPANAKRSRIISITDAVVGMFYAMVVAAASEAAYLAYGFAHAH